MPRSAPDPEELEDLLGRSKGLKEATRGKGLAKPQPIAERIDEVRLRDDEQNLKLKKILAVLSFVIVAVQIGAANAALFWYGIANEWDIDSKVLLAWMGATVVETVGIVYVIAQHLFPHDHE